MQELPDNIMQELPDVPQHGTGPEISSSPATHHDVGSTTDIPEVISPGAGSEDPGQGLFARNHPFSDNISTSDLSKDPSNLNKELLNLGVAGRLVVKHYLTQEFGVMRV
ncbi:hypothetical protein ABBQ38_000031 [Trebouxia sp. C0009 RCD-2024]